MTRVDLTATRLTSDGSAAAVAEAAIAINAGSGHRILVNAKAKLVAIRITNTHASTHAVTVKGGLQVGNSKAVYGAAGPGGSNVADPDFVTAAIAATTGVIYLVPSPGRFFRPDGSYWLDFEAAHTGTIAAIEIS